MSRLLPTLACILGHGLSFRFLSLALKSIPLDIACAIWRARGIVLISSIGTGVFKPDLHGAARLGLALIVAGVAVITLFSQSVPHGAGCRGNTCRTRALLLSSVA